MQTALVCLKYDATRSVQLLAADVYERVCRSDFSVPGYCLVSVETFGDSVAFRRLMVDLKNELSEIHSPRVGKKLEYLSVGRFDQQVTTKFHLDGGPAECFLMLGYEPSAVGSRIQIADYSRCAHDLGLAPQEFLERHNPMFQEGFEILRPYIAEIPCFSNEQFQIVCINNSFAAYSSVDLSWQGVLHTAEILTPDDVARRVINSTMIAPVEEGTQEIISGEKVLEFVRTSVVHRRGHDKGYLADDG
ncbi:MAG: hypothetical protein KDA36_06645 [Planctomycetaceae bacterium]|nr:hypothetical protein [Planctomycetaceae bacterium]